MSMNAHDRVAAWPAWAALNAVLPRLRFLMERESAAWEGVDQGLVSKDVAESLEERRVRWIDRMVIPRMDRAIWEGWDEVEVLMAVNAAGWSAPLDVPEKGDKP